MTIDLPGHGLPTARITKDCRTIVAQIFAYANVTHPENVKGTDAI